MSSRSTRTRVATLAVAALCAVGGCGEARTIAPQPSGSRDVAAVEAAVREVMRAYEAQLRAPIASLTFEDGDIGVYVRPAPAWDLDAYVAALPIQAAAARAILAAVPEAASADVCADGHWLPHQDDAAYATATKVLLFRDRIAQVPADLGTPEQVIRAGLIEQRFDIYVDPKIQTESQAWREARKAAQ